MDERLAARMSRQAILARDDPPPPVLWVLLDEQVLRRDPGDREIMRDQLVHVAEMARRPNIAVQVIPFVSMHAGLMGAFALAETPELPNIVYLENADDGQTIEDPQMGSKMALQFDALRTEALTGRASIATIEKAADQWREE